MIPTIFILLFTLLSSVNAEEDLPDKLPLTSVGELIAVGNQYPRSVDHTYRYRGPHQYSRSYYNFGYRIPYDRKGHYDSPDDLRRRPGAADDYLPGYGPRDPGYYNFYKPIRYSPFPASRSNDSGV